MAFGASAAFFSFSFSFSFFNLFFSASSVLGDALDLGRFHFRVLELVALVDLDEGVVAKLGRVSVNLLACVLFDQGAYDVVLNSFVIKAQLVLFFALIDAEDRVPRFEFDRIADVAGLGVLDNGFDLRLEFGNFEGAQRGILFAWLAFSIFFRQGFELYNSRARLGDNIFCAFKRLVRILAESDEDIAERDFAWFCV